MTCPLPFWNFIADRLGDRVLSVRFTFITSPKTRPSFQRFVSCGTGNAAFGLALDLTTKCHRTVAIVNHNREIAMSPIKSALLVVSVVLGYGIAAPIYAIQTPMAGDQQVPQGHFRLTGVQVDPINRTKTADGKTNDSKSDTLTHSLRFSVRAVADLVDGTKDLPYKVLNPTDAMSVTVDKPIQFRGKKVPIGTNLLDYKEFDGKKFTINMRPLNATSYGSLRLSNDFVFPPDTYKIKFAWTTSERDVISKDVLVTINIKPDAESLKNKPGIQNPPSKYSFLVCGQKTYIVGSDGKPSWTYPQKTRDGYVLEDGSIILTRNKSKKYKGGAVVKISPDGKEKLIWEGTQAEVNSAQPTADGTFVITEAGPKPRLLEVTAQGEVKLEFPLVCQKKNIHLQTRMARKLPDGTFLVPHLIDFAVYNYDSSGKVIGKLDTTVPGDTDHKIHSWPFTAIRHGKGQTLVTCTNGNRVIDFDANGKVVWTLTNKDLPGPWLKDPCGAQVLPNGNVVIASYAAGKANPDAPKLFEVTRDKKVVWEYRDGKKVGVHHFQIIDIEGKKLSSPAMK